MTIREIYDETVRSCLGKKIPKDAYEKVLNTEVVPRKLVEDALSIFRISVENEECIIHEYEKLGDEINKVKSERWQQGVRHCINCLEYLLDELDGGKE